MDSNAQKINETIPIEYLLNKVYKTNLITQPIHIDNQNKTKIEQK